MNRSQYLKLIQTWERQFGIKSRAFQYDPTEIDLCCERCKTSKSGRMARHHKANDFFFALWFPQLYAAQYLEFRRVDCAKLCQKCHRHCERYYAPLKQELYDEYNKMKEDLFNAPMNEQKEWCEEWRNKFLALYKKWLARPSRSKAKRK